MNVHPGSAKDKMVNALNLANAFHQALPVNEVPEHTEGYEGFFHLMELNGNVEKATAQYIIRDHDSTSFENRKQQLIEIQKTSMHVIIMILYIS